jgi:protein-disulfide isomerase
MHPLARLLASAAICAGEQGHYWEMHDAIFVSQPTTAKDLLEVAQVKVPGVSLDLLQECLDSPGPARTIERDLETAQQLKLVGTPSFAIGLLEPSGQVQIRQFVRGAQPLDVFETAIGNALKAAS